MKTFEDEKNEYQKKRMQLMSEEQQALADQIKTWYTDAYNDKESRGIFDKMEEAALYWEGEANQPEDDNLPNSNTNIVNSAIEGQVAYLVEQNIAIEAKPRGPSDKPFRDNAVILMEFCKEQNKLRRQIEIHERRRKQFGTGIFRVLFDPDALDGMGLPKIEALNPAKVFPDPIVHDVYKIQEGRFVIEEINRSIASARDKYGDDIAAAITPGYHPTEHNDMFDEDTDGEIAGDYYLHMLVWTHGTIKKDVEVDTVEIDDVTGEEVTLKEMVKEEKKVLRLIEMSACGVILRDTAAEGIEICEDDIRFPYFFTPDMYREGTVWGKSTASLLIPIQDTIDDIEDQIILNARLTGNPQREVDIAGDVDTDKITNEPGLIIPSVGGKSIRNIEAGQIPAYIIQHRNQKLMQERTIVSRWSDQMNGIKQVGVGTATESLGLQQAGTQNITHDKMLLEDTLSEVFAYSLTLMLENYTETEVFSITEKDEFYPINPSEMREVPVLIPATDEYKLNFERDNPGAEYIPDFMPHSENIKKRIALDISVTVGAGLPNNKAFVFQMIDKLQSLLPPHVFLKLVKEYTGLPIDDELTQPPMQQPPMPQQPMQDANVMGLTQGMNPMMPGGQM